MASRSTAVVDALAPNPLGAVFLWMYDDGPGGTNANCHGANTWGCWGHRAELLGAPAGGLPGVGETCSTCVMGVGFTHWRGLESLTALVARPTHAVAMTFTWAQQRRLAAAAAKRVPTMTTSTTTSTTTTLP